MKERNLLVFIAALIASILFIVSIVVRFFRWYEFNGDYASISTYYLIIPVILLWLGWFLDDMKSVVAASVLLSVCMYFHVENIGVLSGTPLLVSTYAPAIKTTYVLNLVLVIATVVIGFVSYYLPKFQKSEV